MTYSTELANKYIDEYKFLHNDPWFKKNGYVYGYGDGKVVVDSFPILQKMIVNHRAKSILDYGCGKAVAHTIKDLFTAAGVTDVGLYDPAIEKFSELPNRKFDGVVCADVLEHIPECNVDYELDQIVGFAEKFVFFTISCNPAKQTLRTGENVHITLKPPGWWVEKLNKYNKKIYVKFSFNRENIYVDVLNGLKRTI